MVTCKGMKQWCELHVLHNSHYQCLIMIQTHMYLTWTNAKMFCGIYLRAIWQEVFIKLIQKMSSEITLLKLL